MSPNPGDWNVASVLKSNAICYHAPLGTAKPLDTVDFEEQWPDPWERVGVTNAELKLGYTFDEILLEVQEFTGPLDRSKDKERVMLETGLAQIEGRLMQIAYGGGKVTTVAAAAGVAGKDVFSIGGDSHLEKRIWAFEGVRVLEDGTEFPVRCYIWRATAVGGGEMSFSRSAYTGMPLKIGGLIDTTKPRGERFFSLERFTAQPTV